MTTEDDYGQKISAALRAVRYLCDDTSRLLQDCDGSVGKGMLLATKSANATSGLSYSLGRPWMIEGAFRCYSPKPDSHPGLVDAICVCFLGEKVATDQPVLIVGRDEYRLADGLRVQDVCDGWELWYLMGDHCDPRPMNALLSGGPVEWSERSVESFRLIAVPLFAITSIDDVVALMDNVRATSL